MSKLFTVEGLVCVVTGGGTGIGLCIFHSHLARLIYIMVDISAALAQNGATVYIVGRRKEKLETAVKMHKSVLSTITNHLTGAHERKADSPCCRCHIQRWFTTHCDSSKRRAWLHQSPQYHLTCVYITDSCELRNWRTSYFSCQASDEGWYWCRSESTLGYRFR